MDGLLVHRKEASQTSIAAINANATMSTARSMYCITLAYPKAATCHRLPLADMSPRVREPAARHATPLHLTVGIRQVEVP